MSPFHPSLGWSHYSCTYQDSTARSEVITSVDIDNYFEISRYPICSTIFLISPNSGISKWHLLYRIECHSIILRPFISFRVYCQRLLKGQQLGSDEETSSGNPYFLYIFITQLHVNYELHYIIFFYIIFVKEEYKRDHVD